MNRSLVLTASLGVAAVVLGAGVALALSGDEDTPPRPAPTAASAAPGSASVASAAPSSAASSEPATALDALRAKVPGDHVAYVPDPDTAATWNDRGDVVFWSFTQSGWQEQGRSTFPPLLDGDVTVTGQSLGTDAIGPDRGSVVVYVVTGQFTTDAGNGVLVYGPGRSGWGALEDDGTVLASHGRGASVENGTGLFEQVSVGADARLRTVTTGVCPSDLPRYRCGDRTATQSQWQWDDNARGLTPIRR